MRLEIVGCSGGAAPGRLPSALLLGDEVAVDAGSLAHGLPPERQAALRHVLLTHAHLDHVASLPFLLDNRLSAGSPPLTVHAPAETLAHLREGIFDGRIWPRVETLRRSKSLDITLREVPLGEPFRVGELSCRAAAMDHPVSCVGYLLDDGRNRVFVAGDTGSLEPLAEAVRDVPDLAAIVVECSWPSRLAPLARTTGHLTPGDLEDAWPLHPTARVLVGHLKPAFAAEIRDEFQKRRLPGAVLLEDGDLHVFE